MRFEKQNIFFTSDFHIGHTNILKYDNRPFKNVEEMHETLIENWNSKITNDDTVYYLGDLAFNKGKDDLDKWFVNQLKGKIYFIMGNHDKISKIAKLNRFEKIHEYGTEIWIKDDEVTNKKSGGYQDIIMSHYPILSWNRGHHGSFHLHGHSHQSLTKNTEFESYYKKKVIDIGCNGHDYSPLSYNEIKKIMLTKIISKEHHNK